MQCDMCGTEGQLFRTKIEGSEMNVCKECSKFGKVITPIKPKETLKKVKKAEVAKKAIPENEIIQVIVEDYAERVKKAREKLGLKQEEFAKKINERESLIHKIETGIFEPNIDLARKLERALKIKLIEQHEEQYEKRSVSGGGSLTIGDLVKVKKK